MSVLYGTIPRIEAKDRNGGMTARSILILGDGFPRTESDPGRVDGATSVARSAPNEMISVHQQDRRAGEGSQRSWTFPIP